MAVPTIGACGAGGSTVGVPLAVPTPPDPRDRGDAARVAEAASPQRALLPPAAQGRLGATSAAHIYAAMTRRMPRRLARARPFSHRG